jgi:biopolymer transport protein TolR
VAEQDKELYLRADKDASYGLVVEIMGEARAAGVETLGIVAEPSKGRARPSATSNEETRAAQ